MISDEKQRIMSAFVLYRVPLIYQEGIASRYGSSWATFDPTDEQASDAVERIRLFGFFLERYGEDKAIELMAELPNWMLESGMANQYLDHFSESIEKHPNNGLRHHAAWASTCMEAPF